MVCGKAGSVGGLPGGGLPRTRKVFIKGLRRLSAGVSWELHQPSFAASLLRVHALGGGPPAAEPDPLLPVTGVPAPRARLPPGCHRNPPARSGPASRSGTGPLPPPRGQPPAPDWVLAEQPGPCRRAGFARPLWARSATPVTSGSLRGAAGARVPNPERRASEPASPAGREGKRGPRGSPPALPPRLPLPPPGC